MNPIVPRLPLVGLMLVCAFGAISGLPAQVYTIRDLGTQFNHPEVLPEDINNKGQITGYTRNTASDRKGFFIAPPYTTMIYIGTFEDYPISEGRSINEAGVVVGNSGKAGDPQRMIVWSGGTLSTMFPLPGETSGFLNGINDQGVVLGRSGSLALIVDKGQMTPMPVLPGYQHALPSAINNAGIAVGSCINSDLDFKATRWDNGVPTAVADLGGPESQAYDIAENGLIVGGSEGTSFMHNRAFMTPQGQTAINLGTLGGTSEAYGTNGVAVVGMTINTEGLRAFIYEDGMMKDLNDLIPQGTGWTLWTARRINGYGQIIGYGQLNGDARGYLLTPINPTGGAADWIFTERQNGWTAVTNIPPYEPTEAEWLPGLGYGIRATGFPSFGFLQSPEVPLRPGRTYRLWVVVANTAVGANAAPQFRLRAFQTGNNQATILALDSVSNSIQSGGANVYEFTFTPLFSGSLPNYRFNLDFTYFNPEDEQGAWVYLQRLILAEE